MENVSPMAIFVDNDPKGCVRKGVNETLGRCYTQEELRKMSIKEIEFLYSRIDPNYQIKYLNEPKITKDDWRNSNKSLSKKLEELADCRLVRSKLTHILSKAKSMEDREETLDTREFKCEAKLILDGLLMEGEENTISVANINALAIEKDLFDLAFMYNLGQDMKLYTDVIAEAVKLYGLDSVCLLIEFAIAIKMGILEYITIARELPRFKEQDPYEFAKIILQKHGVYYKASSRNKNALFEVTENKWGCKLFPVLGSAHSLSKNKTSVRIMPLERLSFKPTFIFDYIIVQNIQKRSKSRQRVFGSMNHLVLRIYKEFNCDFGITMLKSRACTGFDAFDTTIKACNIRLLKAMFNTMRTKDRKYTSDIPALLQSRKTAIAEQAANNDRHLADRTMYLTQELKDIVDRGMEYSMPRHIEEETVQEYIARIEAKKAECKTRDEHSNAIEEIKEELKEED